MRCLMSLADIRLLKCVVDRIVVSIADSIVLKPDAGGAWVPCKRLIYKIFWAGIVFAGKFLF